MLPGLRVITEGGSDLYVPAASLTGREPATHPVFFNPAARANRDISVSLASVTRPATFLDALAGTGARGVRVANESGGDTLVTLADFSVPSLMVARKNVRRNGLRARCAVVHSEANALLTSRFERREKFDAIDLDPFGTPAPFVGSAIMAASDGGVVSLTATDAAVLCGVYPLVSLRRYGALAPRSDFVHETGLRILLGFAARMGGVNDIGIEPVAVHSTLHYLRAFFRVRRGASSADGSVAELGYVWQCNGCGSRTSGPVPVARCDSCGGRVRSAGPLWTGRLVDWPLAAASARFCDERGWRLAAGIMSDLEGVDRFPPFSFSSERACSRLKIRSVPTSRVLDELARAGFESARQPFEENGIKTDATYEEFVSALRAASGPSP